MKSIVSLFAILCSVTFSATSWAKVPDAVTLDVKPEGLTLIADVIQSSVLNHIGPVSLPDQGERQGNRTIYNRRMNVSVDIPSIKITPRNNVLEISADISNFILNIGLTEIHGLRTTYCYNTQIRMAHRNPSPLKMQMYASVENEQIVLSSFSGSFRLGASNFQTYGPAQCRGRIFSRPMMRSIVEKSFRNARARFESLILNEVRKQLPGLQKTLNQAINNTMAVTLQDGAILKPMLVTLDHAPSSLSVSEEGIKIGMALGIDSELQSKTRDQAKDLQPILLGRLGVKVDFINQVSEALLKYGTKEIVIDNNLFAETNVEEFINTDLLSEFWPDMLEPHITSERIIPRVQLTKPLQLSFDGEFQRTDVTIPELNVVLQAEVEGAFQDYVQLSIQGTIQLQPTVDHGMVSIVLSGDSDLKITGDWAPGYTPHNPTFNLDELNALVGELFSFIEGEGPIELLEVPIFELQGRKISVDHLKFTDEQVFLNIQDVATP